MTNHAKSIEVEYVNGSTSRRIKPVAANLLLLIITIIWGSTFLITRIAVTRSAPFTFLALRFTFASLALVLLFMRRLRTITRYELISGTLIGTVLFLSIAMQTVGAPLVTASKAGFIMGISIPMVPLLALPILRKLPPWEAVIGIGLSFMGLILVSANGRVDFRVSSGELLLLGAAITSALHIVIVSKFAPDADPINLTVVQIVVTAAISAIMVAARHEPQTVPEPMVIGAAAAMGLFASAFALVIMARVQQHVCATRATLIYALEPVWAGGFGMIAGEAMHATAWSGCGLILTGVLVGTFRAGNRDGRRAR